MITPIFQFENLTLGYERHPAVHHLDLDILPGTLTAIVGPNGAGKTTLLKGMVGTLKPLDGTIHLNSAGARDIAYLPQQSQMDRSFPVSVFDLVSLGLWRKTGAFGGIGANDTKRVNDALSNVGLNGFERRLIGTLSGGQFQRALFARLMLQDAPVILLDEPFAAIDADTVEDLMGLIHYWHDEKRTVVAVLHSLNLVRHHFPQTVLISRELIASGATADVLTDENLARAQQFTEVFDDHAPVCHRHPSEAA